MTKIANLIEIPFGFLSSDNKKYLFETLTKISFKSNKSIIFITPDYYPVVSSFYSQFECSFDLLYASGRGIIKATNNLLVTNSQQEDADVLNNLKSELVSFRKKESLPFAFLNEIELDDKVVNYNYPISGVNIYWGGPLSKLLSFQNNLFKLGYESVINNSRVLTVFSKPLISIDALFLDLFEDCIGFHGFKCTEEFNWWNSSSFVNITHLASQSDLCHLPFSRRIVSWGNDILKYF